jgi:hypothetical protein
MSTFVVTMECKVRKRVTVNAGHEKDVWVDPWKGAHDEEELDLLDWTVLKVEPIE